jgi:uncharacterized radical SAM superfamily Fe-S cluster-containing enzyme
MSLAPLSSFVTRTLLKKTTSRCPVCHQASPAEVWRTLGNQVMLERTCPTHGKASVCIASDARFYWLAKGDPSNAEGSCGSSGQACCAGNGSSAGTLGRNAEGKGDGPFENLSTCLALIEIVDSCNLSCPTCYADSPLGVGPKIKAPSLAELQGRIQGILDRKGKIEILQFSGGEPTLHPEFFKLLEWARDNPGIDYLLLNTNGVRLAHEPGFAERLGALFPKTGLQLYLQFDGVQAHGQQDLRGADLRSTREKAIERCGAANIPVTLAMTVTEANLPHLWEAIEFGLRFPQVHGITFQPMFGSGRTPADAAPRRRLNTSDIILAAVGQSNGNLRVQDFTPLPCGDPNCATMGYLVRAQGRTWSISEFLDFSQLQGFLKDKIHYTLEDLAQCGCENEPLGQLLKDLEIKSSMVFRLMVKPFMDAWTWDEDRIDRCCTHVIRPDGKLDSFCRYYSGFPDTKAAP